MDKIKKFFATMKRWWIALKSKFITLYTLTVSYNQIWGDHDDQVFTVRKFLVKKPNHLKFRTESGETVEFQGAEGLNYKIEEM